MAQSAVTARQDGPVTVLEFERGKANALDTELLRELIHHLDDIAKGPHRAIILTGRGSIFSAGVDLFRVVDGGRAYVEQFLPVLIDALTRLFTMPVPMVAAINGHAIAGGCVMASACDYRVMADGEATIGVPELRVQVPFPTAAIEILRFAVAGAHFQELVYLGRTYRVGEAKDIGLVDEIVAADKLLARAGEIARRMSEIPTATFRLTKAQVRQPALERMQRIAPDMDQKVIELWRSPDTSGAIARYLTERWGRRPAS